MIKKIILVLVLIVVGLFSYAAFFVPKEFRISREIKINAPADIIFPYVNSPQKMDTWNPFMKIDPQVKATYSGPESGVGASSTWDGNSEVGAGSATITQSYPNFLVRVKLEYLRPFQSESLVDFSLKPEENQTTAFKWTISGASPLLNRFMCIFMNMDKMIGGTFEKGLADLKSMAEAPK